MSEDSVGSSHGGTEGSVTVRYWAAARTATGVAQDEFPVAGPLALSEVVRRVLTAHSASRVADVIAVCSVLVGDRPVGERSHDDVLVHPGDSVEFLPPFAGG